MRRVLEFLILVVGPLLALRLVLTGFPISGMVGTFAVGFFFVNFGKRLRRGGFPLTSMISAVGLPVYAYLLLRSVHLSKVGGVMWKGRHYISPKRT